jgi:hypothetical protein
MQNVVGQVQLPADDAPVNSEYLVECIVRAQDAATIENSKNPIEGFDPMFFPQRLKSDFIWVARKDKPDTKVQGVNDLLELMCDLTDIQQVTTYTGRDHAEVFVLTGRLPDKWVAMVRNVMVRDIPSSLIPSIRVAELLPRYNKYNKHYKTSTTRKIKLVLRGVGGVMANADWLNVPAHQLAENYNIITMKISRDTHRMLSWFPGADVNSNVCAGPDGLFVELNQYEEYLTKAQRNPQVENRQGQPQKLKTLKDLQ